MLEYTYAENYSHPLASIARPGQIARGNQPPVYAGVQPVCRIGLGARRIECDEAAFSGLPPGENGIAEPEQQSHQYSTCKGSRSTSKCLHLAQTPGSEGQHAPVGCLPPRYNIHTYRVDWESQTVRMSLVGGRQTIRFSVPDYAAKYVGYPVDTADLLEQDREWWLHVVVSVPALNVQPTDEVIGIDLGINRPAVTSHNRFLGAKRWKAIEGRSFKHIRALQKKGTKSAKRRMWKVKRRRARFRRDADHVLSKRIVQAAHPGGMIVLENLKGIRKRIKQGSRSSKQRQAKRRMHSWPFASLKMKIEYKAEERSCMVVAVDPRHTSQKCSCCGHTARNNRRSQSEFWCRKCGWHLHADLNAARNIAAKYRAGGANDATGGLRNQPIVSTSDSCGREAQAARF
jgi:putative transposase